MEKIIIVIVVLAMLSIPVLGMLRNDETPEVVNDNQIEEVDEEEVEKESEEGEEETDYQDYIRSNRGGSVDIAIVLKNIVEDNDENLIFELMLNTHSVDLESVEYENLVNLKTDKINVDEGFSWQLTEGSGHHLSGELKLPKTYKGQNIIDNDTEFVEIEIKDLGGVESRKFLWEKDELNNIK